MLMLPSCNLSVHRRRARGGVRWTNERSGTCEEGEGGEGGGGEGEGGELTLSWHGRAPHVLVTRPTTLITDTVCLYQQSFNGTRLGLFWLKLLAFRWQNFFLFITALLWSPVEKNDKTAN